MKLETMNCPNCCAPFSVDSGKGNVFFCPYCGSKIVMKDDVERFEINYNQTNRHIDDAEIRRVDAEKEIELKRLDIDMKKSKQRNLLLIASVSVIGILTGLTVLFTRTPREDGPSQIAISAPEAVVQQVEDSLSLNTPTETIVTSDNIPSSNELTATTYPNPTNTELSYGFLDYTMFSFYLTNGTFRCGIDFEPGDYYILSLYSANASYGVSDNPTDFPYSNYRIMRKIHVAENQYVKVEDGAILVRAKEVDTSDWSKYGVFLVGKDLPAGDYRVTTLFDEYQTDLQWAVGFKGAYQICIGSPEKEPISSYYLFENQSYISLENGQYFTLINAKVELIN